MSRATAVQSAAASVVTESRVMKLLGSHTSLPQVPLSSSQRVHYVKRINLVGVPSSPPETLLYYDYYNIKPHWMYTSFDMMIKVDRPIIWL